MNFLLKFFYLLWTLTLSSYIYLLYFDFYNYILFFFNIHFCLFSSSSRNIQICLCFSSLIIIRRVNLRSVPNNFNVWSSVGLFLLSIVSAGSPSCSTDPYSYLSSFGGWGKVSKNFICDFVEENWGLELCHFPSKTIFICFCHIPCWGPSNPDLCYPTVGTWHSQYTQVIWGREAVWMSTRLLPILPYP